MNVINNILSITDYVFFFCSEEQIRKKASVLFGIKFDGTNYSTLEEHLKIIKSNKDLVHKCFVS